MSRKHLQPVVDATVQTLADRLRVHSASAPRTIVGLCGPPGSGKSTLAAQLAEHLGSRSVVVVPMDGFHLANGVLANLGLADRKGAPETFDGDGYVATLARLAERSDPVVYAPEFHRDLEESFSAALAVPRDVPLVITEGNYLLLPEGAWPRARAHLDEVWYLELDARTRRDRLIARHRRHGRSEEEATAWVDQVDEPNAAVIAASAERADLRVRLSHEAAESGRPRAATPR